MAPVRRGQFKLTINSLSCYYVFVKESKKYWRGGVSINFVILNQRYFQRKCYLLEELKKKKWQLITTKIYGNRVGGGGGVVWNISEYSLLKPSIRP